MKAAPFIPLATPNLAGRERDYLHECLDTNFVSSVGPFVERFEREVADFVGARFGVATSSGTAALHVALLLAGVEPGDEVLVSTMTFIAPANAIRYAGAHPVFMDAEPRFWQIDAAKVADFLAAECTRGIDGALRNRATGRRVKAILPVHVMGHPFDLDAIGALARQYDLAVIEDAAECLGASYHGRRIGPSRTAACLSFNGNKIITTGGGGMILTDDDAAARRAKHLTTQAKSHPIEYIHDEVGFNYRLTNLQAALGCAQLEQLPGFIERKRAIAARYAAALADLPGIALMPEAPWARSTFWLYTIRIDDPRAVLERLAARGIQSRMLWMPCHLNRAHEGSQAYRCDFAPSLYASALSLPSSTQLDEASQDRVIRELRLALTGLP
jgi:perosamine synthetase